MKSELFVFVVIAYLAMGDALKCYQCSNPPDAACGENKFEKNGVGVRSDECGSNSRCFKRIVEFETANHTTRGCVTGLINVDRRDGALFPIREPKIYYCDTDLCNGASSITGALSTLMALVAVFVFGGHD